MLKKIVLVGASLQSENRGVSALTRGAVNAIIDKYNDVEIKLLCYTIKKPFVHNITKNNKTYTVNEINCSPYDSVGVFLICMLKSIMPGRMFLWFSKKYKSIFGALMEADCIMDISEGDSFSDIYGLKRFITHSTIKISSIRLNKKTILLPQTLGPFKNYFVKKAAGYILKRVNYSFARDMLSYNTVVNELGISKDKISCMPDMAFYMKPCENDQVLVDISRLKNTGNDVLLIGVNISGLLYYGGYTGNNMFNFIVDYKELVKEIIMYFLSMDNVKIVLIPHVMYENESIEDDLVASREVLKGIPDILRDRICLVDKHYREHELKKIIGQCDFFLGGRMHACIAAISMCVPTVPIAYSRKFEGIWSQFELNECIADPRKQSKDEIMKLIAGIFPEKGDIKRKLSIKIKSLKDDILGMFDMVDV